MRILHIMASLSSEWGGPPKVVQGLTEALVKRGIEVTISAPFKKGEMNNVIRPRGAKVKIFKQALLSNIWSAYSSSLARAINEEVFSFDLIHIHEIWHYPHFAAYRVAKRLKKPFIVTPHGALDPWCLNYKGFKKKIFTFLVQRRILNQASILHAITEKEVEDIMKFGVNTPVKVIPNGVDPKEFQDLPAHQDLKRIYPELRNKKVILFLGRIHPKKGLDILARAFGEITRSKNNVYLLIVGPDSNGYRAQIRFLFKKEGLLDKTIFTDMLVGKEKLVVLSGADMFILPSYSEGFSIGVLEAMACGLPVIITHQCNFPEIAENKAGLIINPNEDELTKAITKLLENPVLAKEMGENGQKLVREKFTWDKIADQMIDLYKSVISGKINN